MLFPVPSGLVFIAMRTRLFSRLCERSASPRGAIARARGDFTASPRNPLSSWSSSLAVARTTRDRLASSSVVPNRFIWPFATVRSARDAVLVRPVPLPTFIARRRSQDDKSSRGCAMAQKGYIDALGADRTALSAPRSVDAPTSSFDPLPSPYFLFFSILEPLLTFAGAAYAIFTPLPYYIALYPPSLLAPPTAKSTHVAATMIVRQLGSCFFLFAMMGCVLLPAMRRTLKDRPEELELLVRAYLTCLAAADLTVRLAQPRNASDPCLPLLRITAHRLHTLRPRCRRQPRPVGLERPCLGKRRHHVGSLPRQDVVDGRCKPRLDATRRGGTEGRLGEFAGGIRLRTAQTSFTGSVPAIPLFTS